MKSFTLLYSLTRILDIEEGGRNFLRNVNFLLSQHIIIKSIMNCGLYLNLSSQGVNICTG